MKGRKTEHNGIETQDREDAISCWQRIIGKDNYIETAYLLQDEADLTFKEVKAWLLPDRFIRYLADDWSCTEENIYKLRRKAMDKIDATRTGEEDGVLSKIPVNFYHVL